MGTNIAFTKEKLEVNLTKSTADMECDIQLFANSWVHLYTVQLAWLQNPTSSIMIHDQKEDATWDDENLTGS